MAESAHSAYDKAAEYFNIKVRRVPVNKEFLADVKGFKRCINGNTIMVSFFMIVIMVLNVLAQYGISMETPQRNIIYNVC
jgi:glutamate/tyrosine decarboxylase-like PLP-dependent enzyme